MKASLSTIALFLCGLILELWIPHVDPDQALAEKLLGTVERVDPLDPATFVAGDSTLLFFEWAGFEGPIRGAIRLERDLVAEVIVIRSREGIDNSALQDPGFLESFRGKPTRPPILVEAVTGATISSQALIDAVNERLATFRAHDK